MVTSLGQKNTFNFFFANYKLAVIKGVRSFKVPFSAQLSLLVKLFYKLNIIYSYTYDCQTNQIIIFPRNFPYIKGFRIMCKGNIKLLSKRTLIQYRNQGYDFIIFCPFSKNKFFTAHEFDISQQIGYLLALW